MNTEHLVTVGLVHLSTYLCCRGYAAFLNQRWVYVKYHPDHTDKTVIIGTIIVGVHFAVLCILVPLTVRVGGWAVSLPIIWFASLFSTAYIPIGAWQRKQARERKALAAQHEAEYAAFLRGSER